MKGSNKLSHNNHWEQAKGILHALYSSPSPSPSPLKQKTLFYDDDYSILKEKNNDLHKLFPRKSLIHTYV